MKKCLILLVAMFNSLTFSAKTNVVFSVCQNPWHDTKGDMQEKHKAPQRLAMNAYVDNDVIYLQNLPFDCILTFKNALGEMLLEMQCDSPYLCMLIPKSAVEIDICYNGFVYQGFWND